MSLKEKIENSVYVIRECKSRFKNPCILWSTGKDSTAMLDLVRIAVYDSEFPFDVIHIDTGYKFSEIYEYRDKLAEEWELPLKIIKSPLAGKFNPKKSHIECCIELKVKPLLEAIAENNYDAVVVSIRRDEHEARNVERVFSPRFKNQPWGIFRKNLMGDSPFESLQEVELWDLWQTDFGEKADHVRVHPFLVNPFWNEIDIWYFHKYMRIPFHPLYRLGYRSLGCECCTDKVWSPLNSIEEIIERIEKSDKTERAGRTQDKEDLEAMFRLRMAGYL